MTGRYSDPTEGSIADRVTALILSVPDLDYDIKTLTRWASVAGVSVSALRGYCHAAGLRPKRALDFSRLLRAVVRSADCPWDPTVWFDVSDERHLRSLLGRGGVPVAPSVTPTLDAFLSRQSLVSHAGVLERIGNRLRREPPRRTPRRTNHS